jgi:class 3 adenylate cyclase
MDARARAIPVDPNTMRPGLIRRLTALSIIPANVVGAVTVYFYYNYVDPLGGGPPPDPTHAALVFLIVVIPLVALNWWLGSRWVHPLRMWRRRIRAGTDPADVPHAIRRRALNAALANAILSLSAWSIAGVTYLVYLLLIQGVPLIEALRIFVGIVMVGGPTTSAMAFLVSEYHWRREIPLFYPDGELEREGVVRVPIIVRLTATFFLTSVMPLLVMLTTVLSLEIRAGAELSGTVRHVWENLLRSQVYVVIATLSASAGMALLVARFINRPIQALRIAMARVADGDFTARVPVRSTDELGELNMRFNRMVEDLQRAAQAREIFGRYVSPAVAKEALQRGVKLGGEAVRATAMFVDLRGFTALTERVTVGQVVTVLNEYYTIVQRVTDGERGIITQFLGDGMVIVFGSPLRPVADHADRAVAAGIALARVFRERPTAAGIPLEAGIGICTGDMVAGNIDAGQRVIYTIVGDAVNQAARLQVKTRDLGKPVLITDSTRLALDPSRKVKIAPCGAFPLKGIAAPVEVFAVEW